MKQISNICCCFNNNTYFNFCPNCGKSNNSIKNKYVIDIKGDPNDLSLNGKFFEGYRLYEPELNSNYFYIYICIDIIRVCYGVNENPSIQNIEYDNLLMEKEKLKNMLQGYEDNIKWNDNMFNIYTFIEIS